MNIYKYLGVNIPTASKHGNPFKVFFSKEERDAYLVQVGLVSKEEMFLRHNPELRAKPTLSTNEPL